MKTTRITIAAAAAACVLLISACGSDAEPTANAPASPTASVAPTPAATATAPLKDKLELLTETADLSTLLAAVQAADLGPVLQSTGPLTVFAPNNAAFAKLPKATVDSLLLPCNKQALTAVLKYHVIPSSVKAADITPGTVSTAEGEDVTLAVTGPVVTVNGTTVVTADVLANNGVVHVIDGVLLPPGLDVSTLKTAC